MLFVAVYTPWALAFMYDKEPTDFVKITNALIDISFTIDIIAIFNTAYYDESDFKLITSRKQIA